MAHGFVRVDLASDAAEFQPLVIGPGLPLLDRIGENACLLGRWLGRLAARPTWEGSAVWFSLADGCAPPQSAGRCLIVSHAEMQRVFAPEIALLSHCLAEAQPADEREAALLTFLRKTARTLDEDSRGADRDACFFRYQDGQRRWRLVWCWGYRRAISSLSAAAVCLDPACALLHVRHPHASHRCPRCAA